MSHHTPSLQRGFVFILVLALVMAIMALVLSFNRQARLALDISQATLRGGQALAQSRSGLQLARHLLQEVGDITTDTRTRSLLDDGRTFTLPTGSCHVQVTDESGKLNMNRLKKPDGSLDRMRIDQLLRLLDVLNRRETDQPRLSYGLVPALIDWTDKDEETTVLPFISHDNRGAETPAYPISSGCANRPLLDLAELGLIQGFTPESVQRLSPFLTIHGDGQVNLNSAPVEVLMALSESLDLALARLIVTRRQQRPLDSLNDLEKVPGMTPPVQRDLQRSTTVGQSGPYYRVESIGRVEDQTRRILALVKKNPDAQTVDVMRYEELSPTP